MRQSNAQPSMSNDLRTMAGAPWLRCIVLLNERDEIIAASEGTKELLGEEANQIMRKSITKFFTGDVIPTVAPTASKTHVSMVTLQNGQRAFWFCDDLKGFESPGQAKIGILVTNEPGFIHDRRIQHLFRLGTFGTIVANLVHDIAEPLTVIGMNAEVALDDESLSERCRSNLRTIVDESRRLSVLLRDMLAYARGETRRMAFCDPKIIAERATRMLEAKAAKKEVLLVLTVEEGTPQIECDVEGLRQVLFILVNNALDACHAGGHTQVSVGGLKSNEGASEGSIYFRVEDDGAGVPPELIGRVFEPFFSTKSPEEGTGLGLSIADQIVRAHGGTLEFESSSGIGTKVEIYLPIVRSE
jgi:signal transduction histidine kinase